MSMTDPHQGQRASTPATPTPPKAYRNQPSRVLFFGGGQDSTALLYLYVYNTAFKERFCPNGHLLVIMADTGDEYPETYQHINDIKTFCARHAVEFCFVTPDQGYHGRTWSTLLAQMERNDTIMSVAFPKSCTDNLKIKVCYGFLADWLRRTYGFRATGHRVYYEYEHYYGQLESWIGFAAGEESRVSKTTRLKGNASEQAPVPTLFAPDHTLPRSAIPRYRSRCVTHRYPLLELGMSRADCQRAINRMGHLIPMPSNCQMCPYQNEAEIVFLFRTRPQVWQRWVEREAAKLAKNAHKPVNLGVKGKLALPEYLNRALLKYGTWSVEALTEYRFSHGHCVMSSY